MSYFLDTAFAYPSYSLDIAFAYLSLLGKLAQPKPTPKINSFQEITLTEYKKHVGNRYRNKGQNMTLNSALQAVEKQKEFTGAAVEEFASIFTKQTAKLVEAVKDREERQRAIPPQLVPPLKESKLRNFPNINEIGQKMTGTGAAVAAEANKLQANRKAAKELKIRELAALNAE